MKKGLLLIATFCVTSCFCQKKYLTVEKQNNQSKKYSISFGLGTHLSSSLLPSRNFLDHIEFSQIFDPPKFYFNPEINISFNRHFKNHEVGIGFSAIFNSRILSASLPILFSYSYNFRSYKKNSFFLTTRVGYSFFLTEGIYSSLGVGYRLNKFKFLIAYNNQEKKYSSLMNNKFVSSRIGSFSVKVDYYIKF